jgi:hypothetical protein
MAVAQVKARVIRERIMVKRSRSRMSEFTEVLHSMERPMSPLHTHRKFLFQ